MTLDVEGLHRITNTTRPDRRADIVFVHGLGGASHSTWRHGKLEKPGHFFWPEALGEDLPDCGIWTVGYPAGITKLGKPGMIVDMRAGNLAQKLADAGFGAQPLFFVTHSMGGLVVKSLIVGSQTLPDPDRKRIVGTIRGIVFCATPHRGSAFADAAGVLCTPLGGRQSHVKEMRANAQPLDILHDEFIEWHRNHSIPVLSYAENVGLFKTRWYWRPLPLGLVVPRASANPGIAGHTVRDVDDDHLTLVKPPNREHDVYAGVLLAPAARAAWRIVLPSPDGSRIESEGLVKACRDVSQRAVRTLKWVTTQKWLHEIALTYLILGRAALYEVVLTSSDVSHARSNVEQAMENFRHANQQDDLIHGLLTRAWLRCLIGARTGSDSAQADLDEAWDIAERGLMRLHLADVHLHRARLFHAATPYPWDSPRADLAAARKLIKQCGYGRRLEELADAEAALGCARI